MARIGFIGTGHIAAPMARRLAGEGHEVLVSRRSAAVSAALVAGSPRIAAAENQAVVDGAETVFLCLRPQHAEAAVAPLAFRPEQRIVSVMAGVPAAALAAWCAPARDISITIPLGYLEAGGCPLAVYPHGATLAPLFAPANPVIPVASEAALNSHFAVCAMIPGLLAMLEAGSGWLAERTGDADGAERYTAQLMAGFLAAMAPGAGRLAAEKQALATPGSLSLMMVEALETGGATAALTGAMDAIERRLAGPG
ncbi:pyrroline-5-carboxylate reductase [Paralimibaculum aggregatum]|uniref:Pyrroline-5-carboxylate reductase n=1 Tax=Paralimibaculum aggregatum TaxID=3036245 RepID=A0ABQ6LRU6_9RHOB|nr:NAD(P)-binding domain-containing protein [Limibaculum sp. NKW23]GMG84404.1 pyrroline-5-carboxylate reductase [Limibaculum sp. NKW23]